MKLLIIEDDNICSIITTRVALTSGIFQDIDSVSNGKDVFDYFDHVRKGKATAPDVILLDLNIPLINGFDLITALQQFSFPDKEKIAIIILTYSNDPGDVQRARALGVNDYLLKPLTVNKLTTTIYSTIYSTNIQHRS